MDSRRFNSVWCPFGVRDAFSKLLQAIPKSDLSTYVLCLMMYLMSYDLYHMSYLMSYIIWSHGFGLCLVFRTYDLMTRVDALYLPSTGHLLRILIPLEEPPHLTADCYGEVSGSTRYALQRGSTSVGSAISYQPLAYGDSCVPQLPVDVLRYAAACVCDSHEPTKF